MLFAMIGFLVGAKIGNEIFRYKNPTSLYQPPPFFSLRLTSTEGIKEATHEIKK